MEWGWGVPISAGDAWAGSSRQLTEEKGRQEGAFGEGKKRKKKKKQKMGESEGTALLFNDTSVSNYYALLPILKSSKLGQSLGTLSCRCAPPGERQLLGLHIP